MALGTFYQSWQSELIKNIFVTKISKAEKELKK